jgi:hypothetical protein
LLFEDRLQEVLDDSYPAELRQELIHAITGKWQALEKNFVEPFVPFGVNDSTHTSQLEEQWEMLFDGQEVLPQELLPQASKEQSWLARARYLVSISGRRFGSLKRQGKICWDEELMCYMIQAQYGNDLGLQL